MKEFKLKSPQDKASYFGGEPAPFQVSYVPSKSGTYYIDIYGPIESAAQFSDAITVLGLADEESEVVINLLTPGGVISATNALIHAIRKTKAHVHMVATEAHSCGSLILLCADSFELAEGFYSLIHNGSTGYGGTYNEVKAGSEFTVKWMEKTFRDSYEGFIEPAELDDLLKGCDLYLDADAWLTRHIARNEYFQAKNAAMIAEIQELEAATAALQESKPSKPRARKQTVA